MKYLLEIAKLVAINTKDEKLQKLKQEHKAEIEKEIIDLSETEFEDVFSNLFPKQIPNGSDFYDLLHNFQHNLGYETVFYNFCGKIWAKAYEKMPSDGHEALLNSLFSEKGRGVWRAIFFLPEFCSQVEIEAKFATKWFYRFANKVKDDMASYDFFNGVKNYGYHFPKAGIEAFEIYLSEQLDELRMFLGSLLLGAVRLKAVKELFDKNITDNLDKKLVTNTEIKKRLVYFKSLPISLDTEGLSFQKLESNLNAMLKGEADEISEAFATLYRCMKSNHADEKFIKLAMNWFLKNTTSLLPDMAKHHLVTAIWFFTTPSKLKEGIKISDTDDLLVAIQPISENNRGTWDNVEMYLTERLQKDSKGFEELLERLVDTNPKGMLAQFKSDVLDHLKAEMCQSQIQELMTKWSLSSNQFKREIVRTIFQKSESIVLSDKIISETKEKELEIALLELIHKPLIIAEKTSEYLLALEPAFRNVKLELKQQFKNEMILQAINFPGACLEKWEKIENPSELLKEIIQIAKKYFENLNLIKDSPAISFMFPGCKEAAEREANEFANKVEREAKEKSIFAILAKNIKIIYGTKWAVTMADGKLGQAEEFKGFGHSMEFPRVEIIDPEGMAIRKLEATCNIMEVRNEQE
ncbi:MAG: hypothetical protein A2Y10_19020 [Planctomycetes bacterium GWF2_41_51]|nr:MAG: hypothetical protein A2Y10_19020 [Planctomycetes bacterium GWF2_41_51]HBG27397.1 hypothetical protein [Phycisphaerales bacterium]